MPVNTRSSNVDKHPGHIDLSDDEGSDSSKKSKRGNGAAQRQKKAQKKAEGDRKPEEKAKVLAKLALAKLDIELEDEAEKDNAELPRRRKTCWSEPNTDAEQPPKKRQKDTGGSDMEVDVTNADNMDGIEDTGETSVLRSTTTNKGRFDSEELSSLTSSDEEKTPKKAPSKHQQVDAEQVDVEGNKNQAVKPRPSHKKTVQEARSGDQIDRIASSKDAIHMTDEERTPKANSKAHGHRTATLDDAAALFDSDNEAALVKDPNTPVQTNKRLEAAKDDDVSTEDEAKQTKPSKTTGTRRGLKREGAVILSDDNAGDVPERRTGSFLEKIRSKHVKPGGGNQKDRDGKKQDSPDTDAMTSSKAIGQVPNGDGKRSMKRPCPLSESEKSQSEKSQSELPESPVKVRHHKEKKKLDEAQKEIEKLKKQLRESLEKEKQRASNISDPKADKTRQREAGKAKANGSNSSLPAFEEDQEVERQAMLSSPPKKGKRITSESLVRVEKKTAPKLPREKRKAEVKEVEDNAGKKDAKVRPRPAHRIPSKPSKLVPKSEDVSDQDDLKSAQKADSDVDELEGSDAEDEADTKPNSESKARRKRATNSANLPAAVKNDSVTWRVTIMGAYRAHIACTDEAWVVNDGTALRHLQIVWDYYMGSKQSHKFVANDPVLPLLKQKASDWRHKIGDAGLQALRSYFDQNGLDSIAMRNAAVDILLEEKNFVYKHLVMDDKDEVVNRRGPFCSQLILHAFSAHLSMLNGKGHDIPGQPPPEMPIAAMALATTAVERALTLWQAGVLQEATKLRSLPTFDLHVDNMNRNKDWRFSADNWSQTTRYFVGQLKQIDRLRWNKIVEAAKVYFEHHVQEHRKGGQSSVLNKGLKLEEAEAKNLEFKWDSD